MDGQLGGSEDLHDIQPVICDGGTVEDLEDGSAGAADADVIEPELVILPEPESAPEIAPEPVVAELPEIHPTLLAAIANATKRGVIRVKTDAEAWSVLCHLKDNPRQLKISVDPKRGIVCR